MSSTSLLAEKALGSGTYQLSLGMTTATLLLKQLYDCVHLNALDVLILVILWFVWPCANDVRMTRSVSAACLCPVPFTRAGSVPYALWSRDRPKFGFVFQSKTLIFDSLGQFCFQPKLKFDFCFRPRTRYFGRKLLPKLPVAKQQKTFRCINWKVPANCAVYSSEHQLVCCNGPGRDVG